MSDAGQSGHAPRERVHMLDLLRGVMILLMVGHHLLYDLAYIFGMPVWLVENPIIRIGSPLGAGIFIAMSGATGYVSRSNWVKGLRILAAGAAVTLVTFFYNRNSVIVFGILQFLGVSTLLYAALRPAWRRLPEAGRFAVSAALFALSLALRAGLSGGAWYLVPLGFPPAGFATLDYFPLLPWFAVYLFGAALGERIFGGRMPGWFYRARSPFFEKCGFYSIWIYLLHQPVIMLAGWCVLTLLGRG